jgi:RNase P subunit RPR2
MELAVAVVVALVSVCGFFAWLHYSTQRTTKRQLDILAHLTCHSCGTTYGIEASKKARAEYLEYCAQQRKQRPDLRINFARRWAIHCAKCGARAKFNYESGQLVADAA